MAYARLARNLAIDLPSVQELLLTTPYLAITQRKGLITLTRIQKRPFPGTLAHIRLHKDIDVYVYSPVQRRMVPLLNLVLSIPEFESPFFAGFISMMVRCAPLIEEDAKRAVEEGIVKELTAAVERFHPQHLNWGSVFQPNDQSRTQIPLAPGYRSDPAILRQIHFALLSAKQQISTSTLYPDYSSKTIGRAAQYNMRLITQHDQEDEIEPTTKGLEQIYHKYGIRIQGETEVRWAWKYNDLKPRIYYARGPDQYYESRYIQAIFNHFVDCLPVTNRFQRFLAQTIRVSPQNTLFIYDYAAFTSRLHEIRNFCDELGTFCSGTLVTIVDTYEGIKRVDLGDLILSWNQTCQKDPQFSTRGLVGSDEEAEILVHNCGMLGVPGNISSCTFLHGIHLSILLWSLLCKVVGDDAIGEAMIDEEEELHSCLENLGEISFSKMEFWRPGDEDREDFKDTSWHYTKRPIDRIGDRVVIGEQALFPPVGVMLNWQEPYRTVFPAGNRYLQMKKVANMLISFARQFDSMELQEEEMSFANRFVSTIAGVSGLRHYTQEDPEGKMLLYPKSVSSERMIDGLIEDHWNCVVEVPEWEGPTCQREQPGRLVTFKTSMHRMVKLMKDMGHADVKPRRQRVIVREAEEELRQFFSKSNDLKPSYDVYIFETCPDWMLDFLISSPMYRNVLDVPENLSYSSHSSEEEA